MSDYQPLFALGDVVRVLSYSQITKKFRDLDGRVLPSNVYFAERMQECCEREFEIIYAERAPIGSSRYTKGFYWLSGMEGWYFTEEMLEAVHCDSTFNGQIDLSFDELLNGC